MRPHSDMKYKLDRRPLVFSSLNNQYFKGDMKILTILRDIPVLMDIAKMGFPDWKMIRRTAIRIWWYACIGLWSLCHIKHKAEHYARDCVIPGTAKREETETLFFIIFVLYLFN